MGPETNENMPLKVTTIDRVKYAIESTVKKYFEHPLYYIFYITLSCAIIGSLFGRSFSLEFWVILIALAAVQAYSYFIKNKQK